jgi:hypothetical protein
MTEHPALNRQEASDYLLRHWRLSYVPHSLARLGAKNMGPVYHMRGHRCFYRQDDLDTWAQSKITAPRRRVRRVPEVQAQAA